MIRVACKTILACIVLTFLVQYGNAICIGQTDGTPFIDKPMYYPVTTVTATLGATIESEEGSAIIESGIVYGTAAKPDITGNKVRSGAIEGAFTVDLAGLIPNTTYHFRGYAVNAQGTGYTDDATFTTHNGQYYRWQPREIPGSANWSAVASSSDGTKIVAAQASGYVYTSADSGVSWTRTSLGYGGWDAVASSSDGTKLVAVQNGYYNGSYIFTSSDSGATWVQRTDAGKRYWGPVASSSDGTKLVIIEHYKDMDGDGNEDGGYIYTSTDSGATWNRQTSAGNRRWQRVVSSADGSKLFAVESYWNGEGGYIYTSMDSGLTWTQRTSAGKRYWGQIASSSDGTKLVAAENDPLDRGYILTSIDSGATWVQQTNAGSGLWGAVASSSDGTKLVASEFGTMTGDHLCTSTDSGATWTRQTSTTRLLYSAIASSSDGTKLVAVQNDLFIGGGHVFTSSDSGAAWTQQASPGNYRWRAAAASSDGGKIIVAEADDGSDIGGDIYTSLDFGATWIKQEIAGDQWWTAVASSSDGAKLVAATWSEIYTSIDSGVTWIQQGIDESDHDWATVASSSDGVKLVAADSFSIYSSSDSGATWIERTNGENQYWQSVASSSDGTKLFAVEYYWIGEGGYIHSSSDSGATWTERTSAGIRPWRAVASSWDGTKLVAVVSQYGDTGYIYTSVDSGATWTQQTNAGSRNWRAVASSSSGVALFAAEYNGYIYVSVDSGVTWTPQTGVGIQYWTTLATSSDGSKLIAAVDGGGIYTGTAPTLAFIDTPTIGSIGTTSATLGATIESDGGASITTAGIAYGLDEGPDITGNTAGSGATSGTFTADLTGLTSNTLYHFRGYATNSQGPGYTSESTFTTLADAPVAIAATGLTSGGFTANWSAPSGTAAITGYRLDVATDSGFTTFVPGYNNLSVAGTSASLTGLSPSGTYYYRVRAVNAGGTSSNSNTATAITAAPPLMTITSPGESVSWKAGSKQTISWTYNGMPGSKVRIELLKAGSVTKIASSVSAGKSGSGSYTWTLPSTLKGTDCQVRVTSTANSSYTATSSNFTVEGPTIELNPIQNSTAGNKLSISWKYMGSPGNVKIELLQGGSPIKTIKSSTSAGKNNAGSYSWTIPKTQATGAYQVRVTAVASGECTSTSNSFTIAGPTITLNTIQNATAGGKLAISWGYSGSPGNVKIELLKGGSPVKTIKSNTGAGKNSAGSYTWTIPKTQASGSDYQVRVTATADSSCGNTSENFSIGSVQASAGPDQHAKASAVVNLSALNSTGVKENSATYEWVQTAGPAVELSDPNAAETIFLAPENDADGKSLGFQLTVTNSEGVKSEDSCIVNVSENNAAPIAEAGPNQAVLTAQIVELDGSRSSASGSIVAYGWRQVSGTPVALTDAFAIQTTFVAPDVNAAGESLVFELTITDQAGLRSRDTCVVNVIWQNQPPVANAGQNQTVRPGARVVLDGTGSIDEDDAIASYRWKQLSGKPITLSDPAAITPSFLAPVIDADAEELVFQLFVTDAGGLQGSAKTIVFVSGVQSGKKQDRLEIF